MRPTRRPQSALRTPLNVVLGTEVNVRLLRILARTSEPLSGTQLARQAALTAPGVYHALEGLREAGIVERLGLGSRGQFRLKGSHPLADPLRKVFDAERGRLDELFQNLRRAAENLSPPPRSLWAYGPVAVESDRLGDPVQLAVIAGSQDIGQVIDHLRAAVAPLERQYDVTIEVRGLTDADLAALPPAERSVLEQSHALWGLPPDFHFQLHPRPRRSSQTSLTTRTDRDQHLLALAAMIASKLRTNPTLVDGALKHTRHRVRLASPGEQKELQEWETVLRTMSGPRLRRFLVDPGPRATRLRQTLPFLDALSPEERDSIRRPRP